MNQCYSGFKGLQYHFVKLHTNINTCEILTKLGFVINYKKSQLQPPQEIGFLGFTFNSKTMIMSITDKRKSKVKRLMSDIYSKTKIKIRRFSKIIGYLVSICPAMTYGWLYTKKDGTSKILGIEAQQGELQYRNKNNFSVEEDFLWWLNNADKAGKSFKLVNYNMQIFTDASKSGWGAVCDSKAANGF
nr:unnamed protein product [Callosobruchus analis]